MPDPFLVDQVATPINASPRLPISLCLDVSTSMDGEPMVSLNEGLQQLYQTILEKPYITACAQIGITVFANEAMPVGDFDNIPPGATPPTLKICHGGLKPGTNLSRGVLTAYNRIQERVEKNAKVAPRKCGVPPYLVIISDGVPSRNDWQVLAGQVREKDALRQLIVYTLGVGPHAGMGVLDAFTTRNALRLKGYDFRQFFKFIGLSLAQPSKSQPGDQVRLDTEVMKVLADATEPATPLNPAAASKLWGELS